MSKINGVEIWKAIVGYEGLYEVSNHGRVRALDRHTTRGFKKGRILKPAIGTSGYYHVALTKERNMRTLRIHRLVAESFVSNEFNHGYVNHKDGNKLNNMSCNVEWCTFSQNCIHAYRTGLNRIGGRSKLNTNDVEAIRSAGKAGSYLEMANRYGISPASVWNILNGKTWQR